MNLVKWFRKNNTKVMAVVVIVLMIGFIGGSSLRYLLGGSGQSNDTVAHYGAKRIKITRNDRAVATQELEILQAMRMDQLLLAVFQQRRDISTALLSQLLFEQSSASSGMMDTLKQVIQQNRLRISDSQLAEFSDRSAPMDIYWLLLRNEAEAAGFRLPIEDVGNNLGTLIPNLFGGAPYAQVMDQQVRRFNVPAETIIGTVGKLLAVLEYADAISSLGDTTLPQVRYMAAAEGQSMDLEFVRIEAATFADKDTTPPEDRLQAQFEQFKDIFPGQTSEADPFGFGYKQPARLQLGYIAVKLDDVSSTISRPTAEEMEAYYRQNRDQRFTRQVPSDPNDPQSPTVPQVRSYIDVAETIRAQLVHDRTVTKARQILLEARAEADANLPVGTNENKPSVEALAKGAGNYMTIAESLGRRYDLPLYSGRTGQLSAVDVQQATYLGQLALTNYGPTPLPLVRMLFSVEQLGDNAVTLLSAPQARMYRSIGPAEDPTLASTTNVTGKIMALVRIIDVNEPGAPPALDTTYNTQTMVLGDEPTDEAEEVYSVRKQVVEDTRDLMGWDIAEAKAEEFASLAKEKGWDDAVNEFNTLYGDATKEDPNDPNVFNVDRLVGVKPIPTQDLLALKAQSASSPSAAEYVERLGNERHFINQLYSLIPADSNSLAETPMVMPYRPDLSLYCLKSVTIRRVTQEQYQQMKGTLLSRERFMESQELAMVHFLPKNIIERMQFEFVEEAVTSANSEEAATTEEES